MPSTQSSNEVESTEGPITSIYANDPDFAELLAFFVGALDERRTLMETSLENGDIEALMRTAHQMKGSAAGYGFPHLTTLAGELESACKGDDPAAAAERLADVVGYIVRIDRNV